MQTKHSKFSISLHLAEFEQLKKSFPTQAIHLDNLAEILGPKAIIRASALTPEILNKLDVKLIDHLYGLAYNLREEKFWSYYLQLSEILKLPKSRVSRILEIGKGEGIFESLLTNFDFQFTTLDIKQEFLPDIQGNVLQLPFADNRLDLICAFEVLQHIPHDQFQPALQEMSRCAKNYVFLSLPCPISSFYLQIKAQFLQRVLRKISASSNFFFTLPLSLPDKNETQLREREDVHNPHYWEINRKSYPKSRILAEIETCNLKVNKAFHNPYYPYHFFVLCDVVKPNTN